MIIPLHKNGDESDVKHYRGTTVVSCMSKLGTAALNKRIAACWDLNNTISDAQFGFRKGSPLLMPYFVFKRI